MIPRYSRPEMVSIWEAQTKFEIWFEIEAHACDAQASLGVIPADAVKAVWERGQFEIDRRSLNVTEDVASGFIGTHAARVRVVPSSAHGHGNTMED